ncbi:hypothetical protein GGX14DRAFT_407618 [Mycena pura]|uniref:Uncharacterized protein n=1 Tax=Mycena pura TaxID=153505 RepID=A0AAD6US28_9AGAR|nr:hypothetical protein GGX14DRAFT_407618 [Mycena pura]
MAARDMIRSLIVIKRLNTQPAVSAKISRAQRKTSADIDNDVSSVPAKISAKELEDEAQARRIVVREMLHPMDWPSIFASCKIRDQNHWHHQWQGAVTVTTADSDSGTGFRHNMRHFAFQISPTSRARADGPTDRHLKVHKSSDAGHHCQFDGGAASSAHRGMRKPNVLVPFTVKKREKIPVPRASTASSVKVSVKVLLGKDKLGEDANRRESANKREDASVYLDEKTGGDHTRRGTMTSTPFDSITSSHSVAGKFDDGVNTNVSKT